MFLVPCHAQPSNAMEKEGKKKNPISSIHGEIVPARGMKGNASGKSRSKANPSIVLLKSEKAKGPVASRPTEQTPLQSHQTVN
jgi:hypothetical protein